jgi:tetratricopeptide (TPR) repeat protein
LKSRPHQAKADDSSKNGSAAEQPPRSIRKQWTLRICALVFVPLFLLGGVELILRLSGFGHPTTFFVRTRISGKEYYVPNEKFGLLYFPTALVRSPLPLRMPVEKGSNTFRIFLFGESAAQGDPDPTYGVARYLQVLLRERYPGTEFEVVCVAMTAINSHAVLQIARECTELQGDMWLVYMGNNEVVGPFGAGTVFGAQAPPLWLIRASLAVKRTKIGQALEALAGRFKRDSAAQKSWGGMKMFMEHQVRFDDPARLRVYRSFEKNVEDIARAGRRAGVPIVLSTVASNLKDCAPFASMHGASLDDSRKTEFETALKDGLALESRGGFVAALRSYSNAAAIDPQFAELQFRLGTSHLAMTNRFRANEASREFELARDFDSLAFRADSRINQIIFDAAGRSPKEKVDLLNAMELFATNSPAGIPGEEAFYEHVHFHFVGNYLLARAFAEHVARLLPTSITAHGKAEWATAEVCDRRLAVTVWDRRRLWQNNMRRLFEAPFINQSDHAIRVGYYRSKLEELDNQMNVESPEQSRKLYEEALAIAPDDYFLHSNFGEFLDAIGDLSGAIAQQERVRQLLPGEPMPNYKIGRALVRQGKTGDAVDYFHRALALRPDFVQALNEMGLLLANQQKVAEAEPYFERALKKDPNYSETYLNLGIVAQTQGKLDQAMVRYEEAARLEPEGPAAHFFQGVNFAAQHRRDEAIQSFSEAVRLKPGFWQASYLLGVELAGENKVAEAQEQFQSVIRLRPDYGRAHLNLGVALAKQGKFEPALEEFKTTLRLNPDNRLASQHIATIQAMKRPGP